MYFIRLILDEVQLDNTYDPMLMTLVLDEAAYDHKHFKDHIQDVHTSLPCPYSCFFCMHAVSFFNQIT
jgi:hypothetical protein